MGDPPVAPTVRENPAIAQLQKQLLDLATTPAQREKIIVVLCENGGFENASWMDKIFSQAKDDLEVFSLLEKIQKCDFFDVLQQFDAKEFIKRTIKPKVAKELSSVDWDRESPKFMEFKLRIAAFEGVDGIIDELFMEEVPKHPEKEWTRFNFKTGEFVVAIKARQDSLPNSVSDKDAEAIRTLASMVHEDKNAALWPVMKYATKIFDEKKADEDTVIKMMVHLFFAERRGSSTAKGIMQVIKADPAATSSNFVSRTTQPSKTVTFQFTHYQTSKLQKLELDAALCKKARLKAESIFSYLGRKTQNENQKVWLFSHPLDTLIDHVNKGKLKDLGPKLEPQTSNQLLATTSGIAKGKFNSPPPLTNGASATSSTVTLPTSSSSK